MVCMLHQQNMTVFVIGTDNDQAIFDKLQVINDEQGLNLALSFYMLNKLSDKFVSVFVRNHPTIPIIAIIKNIPMLIKVDNGGIVKSYLNWQSLTKRIVTAGRKSELILQACKPDVQMRVIDGTAGFGHDGLIIASSGANVVMIEQNPMIALLLFYEYQMMNDNPNWQKLLSRIDIHHNDFLNVSFMATLPKVALVYLDPMFPSDSYAAKVNKNMQILHTLASPPSMDDECLFLKIAQNQLMPNGKIIIKRPLSAPYLANQPPVQSFANDAIRFDRY